MYPREGKGYEVITLSCSDARDVDESARGGWLPTKGHRLLRDNLRRAQTAQCTHRLRGGFEPSADEVMRPSTPNSKKPICMPGRLFPATLGPGFRGVRGKNANNGLEVGSSESNSSNEGGMYVIGNEHGVGVALGTVFASGSSVKRVAPVSRAGSAEKCGSPLYSTSTSPRFSIQDFARQAGTQNGPTTGINKLSLLSRQFGDNIADLVRRQYQTIIPNDKQYQTIVIRNGNSYHHQGPEVHNLQGKVAPRELIRMQMTKRSPTPAPETTMSTGQRSSSRRSSWPLQDPIFDVRKGVKPGLMQERSGKSDDKLYVRGTEGDSNRQGENPQDRCLANAMGLTARRNTAPTGQGAKTKISDSKIDAADTRPEALTSMTPHGLMSWLTALCGRRAIEHTSKTPEVETMPLAKTAVQKMTSHELSRLQDSDWIGKSRVIYDARQHLQSRREGMVASPTKSIHAGAREGRHGIGADLIFSADFEGGNLAMVTQVGKTEFDIMLSPDTNTRRHMQWFYFRISHLQKSVSYKLNIVNLCKSKSLYNNGLRPLTYSEQRVANEALGWIRSGFDIAYFKSSIYHRKHSGTPFRTLTFTYTGEYANDSVYFAHCYPYPLQQLNNEISQLLADKTKQPLIKRSCLCKTQGKHECVLLEVTEPTESMEEYLSRQGVVITARCHPGETPSSFMMRGIVNFLTSNDPKAERLRRAYVFKLIPMSNPDGVVSGNSRSTLEGADLNRMWLEDSPEEKRRDLKILAATKALIAKFSKERSVRLVLDLHSHSRRCNVFTYGCRPSKSVEFPDKQPPGFERVFPKMLSESCRGFKYSGCSYKLNKSKEGTARAVVHRQLGIRGVYTIEASFLGGDFGKFKGRHYTIADYQQFGVDICHAMLGYSDADQVQKVLEALQTEEEEVDEEGSDDSDYSTEGDSEDDPMPESPRLQSTVMSQFLELERRGSKDWRPARRRAPSPPVEQGGVKRVLMRQKKIADKPKPETSLNRSLKRSLSLEKPILRPASATVGVPTCEIQPSCVPSRARSEFIAIDDGVEQRAISRIPSAPERSYSDTSDLAPDSTPDFTPTDGVLERIEKMREQWDGMHTEFAQLQDRVQSYDGYAKKVFQIPREKPN